MISSIVLTSARLTLRPLTGLDATQEYARWLNDPDVTRYLDGLWHAGPQDRGTITRWIHASIHSKHHLAMAIVRNREGDHIGNITLQDISYRHMRAELGTMIGRKDLWGRRYGTEAKSMMCRIAFEKLGLEKLTSGHVAANTPSIGNNLVLGFSQEGYFEHHLFNPKDGHWYDVIQMALLKSRFTPYEHQE